MMLSMAVFAQKDTIKTKEVGLVFSNLNSFGLCYKTGNQNTLFRITALSLTGTNTATSYTTFEEGGNTDMAPSSTANSIGAGLNFGFEKRSRINERFYFYYGLVLVNSYTTSNSNTITPTSYTNAYYIHTTYYVQTAIVNNTNQSNVWTISSGLGIVIGAAYHLNRSFSIGAELLPSGTYSYSDTKTTSGTYTISWGVNSNAPSTVNEYDNLGSNEKITKGISFSVINTGAAITIAYKIR